jgi:uncharacterized integral membrane protein
MTVVHAQRRWWLSRRELLILVGVLLFGVSASSLHELMFGEGVAGLPAIILASSLGGLFWGLVIVGALRLAKSAKSTDRTS